MPPKKSSKQKTSGVTKKASLIDEGDIQNDDDDMMVNDENSEDEMTEDENVEIDDEDKNEDDDFNDDYELDEEKSVDYNESDNESQDDIKIVKQDNDCVYDFLNNNNDDDDENDDVLHDVNTMETIVSPENRITKNVMTSYERVRILGTRAKQLASGAKPLIANVDGLDPKEIAKLELKHKMTPFKIRRPLPNGDIEEWSIKELEIN